MEGTGVQASPPDRSRISLLLDTHILGHTKLEILEWRSTERGALDQIPRPAGRDQDTIYREQAPGKAEKTKWIHLRHHRLPKATLGLSSQSGPICHHCLLHVPGFSLILTVLDSLSILSWTAVVRV